VAQLWPVLFDRCGLEIGFAHRTFEWGSEARAKAQAAAQVCLLKPPRGRCKHLSFPHGAQDSPVARLFFISAPADGPHRRG